MRTLEVPAAVGSLDRVNALVRDLAAEAALPDRYAYQLRLATEELFTNIVRHGYGAPATGTATADGAAGGGSGSGAPAPDARVVIEAGVTEEGVWIRLIDRAAPFDPFQEPAVAGWLDRLPLCPAPGILGLELVRHAVDTARHEYVDGTNRTTVYVRRGVPGHRNGHNGHGGNDR